MYPFNIFSCIIVDTNTYLQKYHNENGGELTLDSKISVTDEVVEDCGSVPSLA